MRHTSGHPSLLLLFDVIAGSEVNRSSSYKFHICWRHTGIQNNGRNSHTCSRYLLTHASRRAWWCFTMAEMLVIPNRARPDNISTDRSHLPFILYPFTSFSFPVASPLSSALIEKGNPISDSQVHSSSRKIKFGCFKGTKIIHLLSSQSVKMMNMIPTFNTSSLSVWIKFSCGTGHLTFRTSRTNEEKQMDSPDCKLPGHDWNTCSQL